MIRQEWLKGVQDTHECFQSDEGKGVLRLGLEVGATMFVNVIRSSFLSHWFPPEYPFLSCTVSYEQRKLALHWFYYDYTKVEPQKYTFNR